MTTKALAKFTAELCYEKLSAHSIEMAKKCLLDWLGIAIRGSQEKPVRIIHDVILQVMHRRRISSAVSLQKRLAPERCLYQQRCFPQSGLR